MTDISPTFVLKTSPSFLPNQFCQKLLANNFTGADTIFVLLYSSASNVFAIVFFLFGCSIIAASAELIILGNFKPLSSLAFNIGFSLGIIIFSCTGFFFGIIIFSVTCF